MSVNLEGSIAEEIRISEGNNEFTFPPRNIIVNQTSLDAISNRAEYVIIPDSNDPSKNQLEIADPDLKFLWTKNEGSVIRFGYDYFSKRWLPLPGGPPDNLGNLGNDPRLVAPVPDETVVDATYEIYIGENARILTFNINLVDSESDFSDSSSILPGVVELSRSDGTLNFSANDVEEYGGIPVIGLRQNFFEKTSQTGAIGSLPASSAINYDIFLNPKPSSGQLPRVRIDYQNYLNPVEISLDSGLGSPTAGTFQWAADTGRIRLSDSDIDNNANRNIYYDGITQGEISFTRISLGNLNSSFPNSNLSLSDAIGITDQKKYIIFAEQDGVRRYWKVQLVNISAILGKSPKPGVVFVNTDNGQLYFNAFDNLVYSSWNFYYIDTVLEVEHGVSIQFFRSGVNSSGIPQVPDFHVRYNVNEQMVSSRLLQSPFIFLPTIPLIDNDLTFTVDAPPGTSRISAGDLSDGTKIDSVGYSYILNLDQKQLSFVNRKTHESTISRSNPVVKLPDAAISPFGLEIFKNGIEIFAGVDFDFDPDTGLIEFIEPVGVNEPNNPTSINATPAVNSRGIRNILNAEESIFSQSDVGKYILVRSGSNEGIYKISSFIDNNSVEINNTFFDNGSLVFDLVNNADLIVDRFWTPLTPPFKKFSLTVTSKGEPSRTLDNSEYSVLPSVGQVNLNSPAKPGDAYTATYIHLESVDNGVTVTSVNKVETASFRIFQEKASSSSGSKIVNFNPDGRKLSTVRPFKMYVNGVPLDEEEFSIKNSSEVILSEAIKENQIVIVDYWVQETIGGETSFNLSNSPIDLDPAEIVEGQNFTSFNGDQTSILSPGSPLFIGEVEIIIVDAVEYDPDQDVTHVTFESTPTVDSAGSDILVSQPISSSYRVLETADVDVFPQGSNELRISGDVTDNYVNGTIIIVGGDPYSVLNSTYDKDNGVTKIHTASPAKRNVVVPTVVRTVKPVAFPGSSFQTNKPANIDYEFILIRMNSNGGKILFRDVDYEVSEGGLISLNFNTEFGDSITALYVARINQPVGTNISAKYAYAIVPNDSNGLLGKRLLATYNLYAPDTFYYRIETLKSFLPEVLDLLRSSASAGVSGPNISDMSSQTNSDFGRPGLYFDERNHGNVDEVIRRLLLFYNNFVNYYEDILSNWDGRIVGGNQGKFRFDNNLNNQLRSAFDQITNDIDDQVKLYDKIVLTDFFSFDIVPVYGTMAIPNSLSRIYPTFLVKSVALNDLVGPSNFGALLGSLDVENIKHAFYSISTKARSFFTKSAGSSSYTIEKNGDADSLIPPFSVGQDIEVYTLDGVLVGSGSILSITGDDPITIVTTISNDLIEGTILQDTSDSSNPENHFYSPGRDFFINLDNGQITNISLSPPLADIQNEIIGNEIIDVPLIINNSTTKPRRIPALDGSTFNDNGVPSFPLLKRESELSLLEKEKKAFTNLGSAELSSSNLILQNVSITLSVDDVITFVNGPNTGVSRTISSVPSSGIYIMNNAYPNSDSGASDFEITSELTVSEIIQSEINIIQNNIAGSQTSLDSQLLTIDSEITSIESIIDCLGNTIITSTGTTNPVTLTDSSVDFLSAGVNSGDYIFVSSGANRGLYIIQSVSSNLLLLNLTGKLTGFPSSSSTAYSIISSSSFLSPEHGILMSEIYANTLNFLDNSQSFSSNISESGKASRIPSVDQRINDINSFITRVENVLVEDNIYEMRYLWIDQRANRREGTLSQKIRAKSQREDNLQSLIENQQKLLVIQNL